MKSFSDLHPGSITDLGDGTYFENSNIEELVNEEGKPYFQYDVELHSWPTPPVVPEEVYAWRLRLSTQIAGLKTAIDSLLEQLPQPEQTVAKEAWNAGVTIRRDSPLVAQLAGALGLLSEQVDELFIQANAIEI